MWPAVTAQIHHKRHDCFQQAAEIRLNRCLFFMTQLDGRPVPVTLRSRHDVVQKTRHRCREVVGTR
jgi:hypothetical protein